MLITWYTNFGQEWRTKIEEKIYKVWISLIKNLGVKRYKKLIQEFGSEKELWKAKKEKSSIDEVFRRMFKCY